MQGTQSSSGHLCLSNIITWFNRGKSAQCWVIHSVWVDVSSNSVTSRISSEENKGYWSSVLSQATIWSTQMQSLYSHELTNTERKANKKTSTRYKIIFKTEECRSRCSFSLLPCAWDKIIFVWTQRQTQGQSHGHKWRSAFDLSPPKKNAAID